MYKFNFKNTKASKIINNNNELFLNITVKKFNNKGKIL